MCPPGLHITLGIFQRLFDLLEEDCHQLDRKVANHCGTTTNITTFDKYLETKASLQSLEEELSSLTTELQQANQVLVLLLLTQDPQNSTSVQSVVNLINENKRRISTIVGYKILQTVLMVITLHSRNLKLSSIKPL